MTRLIKAMIVDDEPLAREGLLMRLQASEGVKVIGSFACANDAMLAVSEYPPDLVFLDIEMPGMSGIEFARWLKTELAHPCKVVFVTAYRDFALSAFEFEAFDYLLKPFADDRLEACLNKLKKACGQEDVAQKHQALTTLLANKTGNSVDKFMKTLEYAEPGKLNASQQSISLKSGTQWLRIKLSSIFWIEAAGDYMCVHTQEGTHIIRKTLKDFQDELDEKMFVRVNRSAIINVYTMSKLTPNSNGEYFALLNSGDSVKVTRKYKTQLDELS